ncbi:MAG: fibronectin type III domain-containing protein, partial [Candidatus Hydrogenedentes bacterium]|nr:fibronectin type III domain-containing protein [Candidatus Hydrogenedentota bacterium]
MKRNLFFHGLAVFFVGMLMTNNAVAADISTVWDYDQVATETLDGWRFLAVSGAEAPLPTVDPAHLAVVTLPWQLERTRNMGYWLRNISVPKRFSGRDVFLVLESRGPTRVYVNGTLAGERKADGGALRVPIPENLLGGDSFEVAVAVQHGAQPARLNKTRLVAEPHGFSAFVARRENILGSIPIPVADASNVPWRIKVTESEAGAQVGFDDSGWDLGEKGFKWEGGFIHCWFRSKIVVPEKIGGLPTAGKRLNIRARFDDAGAIFLNAKQLEAAPSPPDTTSFTVPQDIKPGQEVSVALRILNKWGSGGLNSLEWRFAEFDVAERAIHVFRTRMIAVDRTLRMHDHANPAWLETLEKTLALLESGRQEVESLPSMTQEALAVLDQAEAMMAETPILLLEPYLQDVRQDRVTVMWETSAPVNSYVEYGEGKLEHKAEEIGQEGGIHEVVLTGLKADTTYQYRVVSGAYRTETFAVSTAPDKKRPFTFLVWGDNRSDPDICEKVSLQMAGAQAEFV